MINQLFDYKLFSVKNQPKWPSHIEQFIKADSFLQNFIKDYQTTNLSKSLWLGYLKNELRVLILLKYDIPIQIVLVQPNAVHFQNKSPSLVLYDIKFTRNLLGCHANLYKVNSNKLIFSTYFDADCSKEQYNDSKDYPCEDYYCELFPNSYAKLDLRLHNNPEGNFCVLKDRHKSLLNFSICDLIQNPQERLNTYLEIIFSSRIPKLKKFFINKVLDEFQKMSLDNSETDNKKIIAHLEKHNLLSTIKSLLLESDYYFDTKAKINSLLSSEHVQLNSLNKYVDILSISDCYCSNENSIFTKLLVFAHIQYKNLSPNYLKSYLQYYFNVQSLSYKTSVIQLVIDNTPSFLSSFFFEELLNSLRLYGDISKLDKFDIIVKQGDEFIFRSYKPCLNESKQVQFSILDEEESFAFMKYKAGIPLEYKRDVSISNSYQHFFYGKISNKVPDEFKLDYQLQMYVLVPLFYEADFLEKNKNFYVQLESHFLSILNKIKVFFNDNKDKKFVLNRVDIQILEPFPITSEELKKKTESIINKYFLQLKELSIEAIMLHYRSQDILYEFEPLSIEFRNNYGYGFTPVKIDFTGIVDHNKSSIEDRRKYAHLLGMVWAYDIPQLIDKTAKEFCSSFGLNSSITSSFQELDIDPKTIFFNPKTNSVDYNQGALIPCLDENGNQRAYGQNQAGIVVGIHTIDLGLSIPIKRILIIGDLSYGNDGAISSEECIRINSAIRLASKENIPIDWFPASFGIEGKKEKRFESLNAAASTCREIVKATQHKKIPINIIINQANIDAQSYFDALSSICHDTRGILIMTNNGSIGLTNVNDNLTNTLQHLNGYKDVHGPNAEAMVGAYDLNHACLILIIHHYYSYSSNLKKLVDLRPLGCFEDLSISETLKKEILKIKKGYFANRHLIINELKDYNSPPPLYLWSDSTGIRGQSVSKEHSSQKPETLIAKVQINKRVFVLIFLPTRPCTPTDSELIARAIHKASSTHPILLIGSLTGFNNDILSMENRQLNSSALLIKSIIEYDGVILAVNIGKSVSNNFLIFNKQLNPHLKMIAIQGSKASIIKENTKTEAVFQNCMLKIPKQKSRILEFMKVSLIEARLIGKNKIYNKLVKNLVKEVKKNNSFNKFYNDFRTRDIQAFDDVVSIADLRKKIADHVNQLIEIYESKTRANDL